MPTWSGSSGGAALGANGAAVPIPIGDRGSVGAMLDTGGAVATLSYRAELSWDAGLTWFQVPYFVYTTGVPTYASGATALAAASFSGFAIIPTLGGATHARIVLTAYTSGVLNVTLRAVDTPPGTLQIGGPVSATGLARVSVVRDDGAVPTSSQSDAVGNSGTFGNTNGVLPYIYNGTSWDRMRTPFVFKDINAVAIGAIATIWTPGAGKKFRLMGGNLSVSAAISILLEDNAGAAFIFRIPKLLVDTPYNFDLGNGFLSAAANNVLKATGSGAANLTGTVYGTEE